MTLYWILLQVFSKVFPACKLKVSDPESMEVGNCKARTNQEEIQHARDMFYITYVFFLFLFYVMFMKQPMGPTVVELPPPISPRKRSPRKSSAPRKSSKARKSGSKKRT